MTGAIDGGWSWVLLAYGLSWAVWIAYGLTLWWRARGRSR